MNTFINEVYAELENKVRTYKETGKGDFNHIVREIREAALYGEIESYEQIRLGDLLELNTADDIDDGYVEKHDKTTGGIQTVFEAQKNYDMPELDDFEDREEEKEEGFLTFFQ